MSETKRQDFPRGLWVVATPIGNLADLSPRARQALQEADHLLCEDTRQGAKLLEASGIRREQGGLHRFDAHSAPKDAARWVARMQEGQSVALISDAGTPGISDPGALLVAQAHEAGVRVVPVPGPSAVAALLSVAGCRQAEFAFLGFFPRQASDQKALLEQLAEAEFVSVFVWFESPQRILHTVQSLAERFPQARMVAGKELTKIHESFFVGNAETVLECVSNELEREGERGEWCVLLDRGELARDRAESSDWVKALQCLVDCRIALSDAARAVSQQFGIPKKKVYDRGLELTGKKKS